MTGADGKREKIGLLGGTFDPVHKGHLSIARRVLDRYRLDRILFMPAARPPHKERPLTPFAHRAAMLAAALAPEQGMEVSALEAERQPPSYTVDTLAELHARLGLRDFYLVIGADMFVEIQTWYRYQDIFRLADLVVAARPGTSSNDVERQVAALPGRFTHDAGRQMWCREDGFRILYLAETTEAVSSTIVRQRLAAGKPVDHLVPAPVLEYIRQHRLYRGGGHQGERESM